VLGPQVDGGRAKKRCGLEGLGFTVPPRVPKKVKGRLMLALPVANVTGRAVMVVVGVEVGKTGCGRKARRPGGKRVARSILIEWLEPFSYPWFVLVGFCESER
jgi:hypothetical protein